MGSCDETLTCTNEENIVVAISSCYAVCSDLREGVPSSHLEEERAPPHRQD